MWLSCQPATNCDKPAGIAEISWCKGLQGTEEGLIVPIWDVRSPVHINTWLLSFFWPPLTSLDPCVPSLSPQPTFSLLYLLIFYLSLSLLFSANSCLYYLYGASKSHVILMFVSKKTSSNAVMPQARLHSSTIELFGVTVLFVVSLETNKRQNHTRLRHFVKKQQENLMRLTSYIGSLL